MRDGEEKTQRQASKVWGAWEATQQQKSCDTVTTVRNIYNPSKEEQSEFMAAVRALKWGLLITADTYFSCKATDEIQDYAVAWQGWTLK